MCSKFFCIVRTNEFTWGKSPLHVSYYFVVYSYFTLFYKFWHDPQHITIAVCVYGPVLVLCLSFQGVCVCVSVCPFYNTWIVFVQALQPPPAHPAPAGDISTGSKATTSHAGYKAVRKSSTTNPFQLCYVKTQVLLLTNVAHVIVRFCTFQLIWWFAKYDQNMY